MSGIASPIGEVCAGDADAEATTRGQARSLALASRSRLLEATLTSIPDYVYAFDREHRFAFANPAMLGLFGLTADEFLGRNFADLNYPADLANHLNRDIDRVFADGATVRDEVFFSSPTGHGAYFNYLWGPVWADDGSVELVVGVSRDTSERRAFEEALRRSEARLRAAGDLVGLAIYSWDPATDALEWDERLRAMWGLPSDAHVDRETFEAGIHPADLPRVRQAIARCTDPAGDGRYAVEYRVLGRDDGVTRHVASSGRTSFTHGRATDFIGAAIDVTAQRQAEAAIRASEKQFRSFADHSSNLIWIADPLAEVITYRSAAYERIWGVPCETGPRELSQWMEDVHPDDRQQVEHALARAGAGEVAQVEFRLRRPGDGSVRWLRDTSFPMPDENGIVSRIGGITEDLTHDAVQQVYLVSAGGVEARRLADVVRALGFRVRIFESGSGFLEVAPVLAPGCVLMDLRYLSGDDGLSIPRELRARSVTLPTIALDDSKAGVTAAVAVMKAGAADYLLATDETRLRCELAASIAECHSGVSRPTLKDESASARLARLTPREREVLIGLVEGGTNKIIGQKLGISPRTVELHRAQVMSRLGAANLTELLQIALAAGVTPRPAWIERQHDEALQPTVGIALQRRRRGSANHP